MKKSDVGSQELAALDELLEEITANACNDDETLGIPAGHGGWSKLPL